MGEPVFTDYTREVYAAAREQCELDDLELTHGRGSGVYLAVSAGPFNSRFGGGAEKHFPGVANQVVQCSVDKKEWVTRNGYSRKARYVRTIYTREGDFPTESRDMYDSVFWYAEDVESTVSSWRRECSYESSTVSGDDDDDANQMLSGVLCRFPRPDWDDAPLAFDLWQPHLGCDVFAMHEPDVERLRHIRTTLSALGDETNDCPVPKYQNIVDPNLFVRKGEWVASEWDISHDGKASIVGRGPGEELAHVHSRVVDGVFTPILQLALPVLAKKLQRPALHLPGRRLQAVPKAQRIIVPPKGVLLEGEEGSGGAYEGLWHSDGDVEDIVAVVVYYYNVDAALEGGAMEFASRDMHDMLAWADCGDNGMDFSHKLLTEHRKGDTASSRLPVYSVPVETGTILVFSNYQMIHRVLRMVNTSDQPASRDFALLFIVNPDAKLPSARDHLVSPEYMSETDEERRMRRLTKLHAQLSPNSCFGCDEKVYATGNGCAMIMRWVKELIEYSSLTDWKLEQRGGGTAYTSITLPPTQVNRGMSERLSDTSSKTDAAVRHFLATGINDPSPTAAHTTTF